MADHFEGERGAFFALRRLRHQPALRCRALSAPRPRSAKRSRHRRSKDERHANRAAPSWIAALAQFFEQLAVDAVARRADRPGLRPESHARSRRSRVRAGACSCRTCNRRRARRCRASAGSAASARCGAGRIPGSPGESISAVPAARSTQYQVVLVVVCLPEFRACEISPVSAEAPGTSRLISVLLPAPEGPSTSVVLPASSFSRVARSTSPEAVSDSGSTPWCMRR